MALAQAKTWILVYYHAILNNFSHDKSVVTVVLDTIRQKEGGISYEVEEFYTHPNYTRHPLENDIGLIKLSTNIEFTDYVKKIELNTEDVSDFHFGVVSGWGQRGSTVTTAQYLKYAHVELVSAERCGAIFKKDPSNWVCAGVVPGEGFCKGDSGGPLVSDNKQIGVVSAFKPPCGARPDMYARVDKYIGWINSHINE